MGKWCKTAIPLAPRITVRWILAPLGANFPHQVTESWPENDPAEFSRADHLTMPKSKPWTLISGLSVPCVSNVSLLSAPFSGKMTREDAFSHVPSCERLTPRGMPGINVSTRPR
jgi:hypothetical protein